MVSSLSIKSLELFKVEEVETIVLKLSYICLNNSGLDFTFESFIYLNISKKYSIVIKLNLYWELNSGQFCHVCLAFTFNEFSILPLHMMKIPLLVDSKP